MPKRSRSKHLAAAAKKRRVEAPPATTKQEAHKEDQAWTPSVLGAIIDQGLDRFESYYRPQRLVKTEAEWGKLRHVLRQPLPVAFRLCAGTGQNGDRARQELGTLLAEFEKAEGCTTARGRFVPCPRSFEFADAVALACDAKTLRQEQAEAPWSVLARLGNWLTRNASLGLVSRQEIASAVPVALLGVEPGHLVLDLCAAPGSKTLQALENAASGQTSREVPGSEGGGAVIANELSSERGHILARRCAVLGIPCAAFAVTQHKAQTFPGPTGIFDRIVCDVPCSGDGAARKYPEKWRHWAPHLGRALHARQLQIALRAAALVRVGGLVSYSTCSFNPLENEAVVSALLHTTNGALELVACPPLRGLETRAGLSTWTISDDTFGPLQSYTDVARIIPRQQQRRYRRTMWPAAKSDSQPPLNRCIRLMPFLQNTGGFFVALLRKTADWPPSAPSRPLKLCHGDREEAKPVSLACPPEILKDLRSACVESTLSTTNQLVARGRHKVFYCSPQLVDFLTMPRRRRLALGSVGICVAECKRHWRLTDAGSLLLTSRAPETNAAAARKLQEKHRCAMCNRDLFGSCFSRKMLTRPPTRRRCVDCTGTA